MERSVFAATRFICTYFHRARFPEELVNRVAVNFANALLDGLAVGSNLELRIEINCNGTIALVLVDAAQPFNVSLQELSDTLPSEVVLCVHNDFARLLTAAGETLLYRAKDYFRRLYYDFPSDKPRIRFDAITGRFELIGRAAEEAEVIRAKSSHRGHLSANRAINNGQTTASTPNAYACNAQCCAGA
ncbi:hypothetical protein AAVH_12651 [Aphelenchoides avenae]|nr:hypothetical protein AAVH_12651 [Aphelenchus avenae]